MNLNELEYYYMMHIWKTFTVIGKFFIEQEYKEMKSLPSTGEVINFFSKSVGQDGWARSDSMVYSTLEEYADFLLKDFEKEMDDND